MLYAQPLTRIVALTTSDVRHNNDVTTISVAGSQLEIPEPFATLICQLPYRRLAGTADQLPTQWLFPSRRADQHISVTTLGDRLRRLGVQPRATRLAAVAQLAGEIQPAVLADAIGITARTAAKWVTTSGGNWTGYVTSAPMPAIYLRSHQRTVRN